MWKVALAWEFAKSVGVYSSQNSNSHAKICMELYVVATHEYPILHLLIQGIGNCIQGLIDAVLFVAFTPAIRNNFIKVFICRRGKVFNRPTRFFKESKNYYDNNLRNYSPRYSLVSSSPINITPSQVSATPEPSTSFQESPSSSYSIQNVHLGHYEYNW